MLNPMALQMPGFEEWIVIAVIGLLLFGKRLPEVGRSLGKGIVEFKKGLKGIEDEVDQASTASSTSINRPMADQSFKFDPNTGQPIQPQISSNVPVGAKFDPFTGKALNAEAVASGSSSQI